MERRRHGLPEKRKKVLVLEGGGMRGVFLTGVLQAFADRNYFPFELIIGSSAGALTGCAYAARQIHISRDAFSQTALRKFIYSCRTSSAHNAHAALEWMFATILTRLRENWTRRAARCVPGNYHCHNCPEQAARNHILN
jgi:predicted patatin/cPLA2 family phospholipase